MGESKTREQATIGNTFIHLFNAEIDLFGSTTVCSNEFYKSTIDNKHTRYEFRVFEKYAME